MAQSIETMEIAFCLPPKPPIFSIAIDGETIRIGALTREDAQILRRGYGAIGDLVSSSDNPILNKLLWIEFSWPTGTTRELPLASQHAIAGLRVA